MFTDRFAGCAGSIASGWYQRAPRLHAACCIAGAAIPHQVRPFQRGNSCPSVAARHGRSRSWHKAHHRRRAHCNRLPLEDRRLLVWQTYLRHDHHDGVARVGICKARRPDHHRCGNKPVEADAGVAICGPPSMITHVHLNRRAPGIRLRSRSIPTNTAGMAQTAQPAA